MNKELEFYINPDGIACVELKEYNDLLEKYERMFKIAKEMHLWIFLNTGNEFEVYKELGLTDEENLILGSGIVQDGKVYFSKE